MYIAHLEIFKLHATAFGLLLIEAIKLLSPAVGQPRALIRTHERPVFTFFHTAHEQVRDPQGIEQVSGSLSRQRQDRTPQSHLRQPTNVSLSFLALYLFLLAMVLLQVQVFIDVGMPGLKVDGKGPRTLVPSLVHVAGRVVEHSKHGDQAIRRAIGLSRKDKESKMLVM